MGFVNYLFGPAGRFRRRDYLIIHIICGIMYAGIGAYLKTLGFRADELRHLSKMSNAEVMEVVRQMPPGVWAGLAVMIWMAVMAAVKRLHDFGSSGWLVLLVLLIPLINFVYFLKFLFFRGEFRDNRYGKSPYRNF